MIGVYTALATSPGVLFTVTEASGAPRESDPAPVSGAHNLGTITSVVRPGAGVDASQTADTPASVRSFSVVLADSRLSITGAVNVEIEDVRITGASLVQLVCDGTTHVVVDGHEAWVTSADLRPEAFQDAQILDGAAHVAYEVLDADALSFVRSLATTAPAPAPLVGFASMELAPLDAARVGALPGYSVHARFRVRGPGQYGTVLAASLGGERALEVFVDPTGFTVTHRVPPSPEAETHVPGNWSDGKLHHLILTFVDGSLEVAVDGWLEAHVPASTPAFDRFCIGQDLAGSRLMGEVASGGIHAPLGDQQVARLSARTPLPSTVLFDGERLFHRIPALIATREGTLLAFADRRRDFPNDAPNSTSLAMRRSTDGGETWSELVEVVKLPGSGLSGAAATDCAPVQDRNGRIHLLFDVFPGGIGLLNSEPGTGFRGDALRLSSPDGEFLLPGWPALPTIATLPDGTDSDFLVDERGTVSKGGKVLGDVLTSGPVRVAPTGGIGVVTSDDDGRTWSPLRLITPQVKDAWMTFLGLGPGNGIRLSGRFEGRLCVPCYFSTRDGKQMSAAAFLSDDDGVTWRRGGSTNDGREVDGEAVDPQSFTNPAATMTESALVQIGEELHMFSRSQHGFVLRTVSMDGGETWGDVREDGKLPEIFCQPAATIGTDGALWFANASRMLPYRGCGTVYRAELKGGNEVLPAGSITPPPASPAHEAWVRRAINPRHHGYQSLAPLPGGAVGMLWERETAGVWFTVLPAEIFQTRAGF